MDKDNTLNMLEDAVARMLADRVSPRRTLAAEAIGIDRDTWHQMGQLGVAGPACEEMDFSAQAVVLKATGYAGTLVPYAESEVLGRWLAHGAGIDIADDILTVSVLPSSAIRIGSGEATLDLRGRRVPWARHAQRILFSVSDGERLFVASVTPTSLGLRHTYNLAAEPHDEVVGTAEPVAVERLVEVGVEWGPDSVMARGALCRTLQMQGAMARVNELTLQYAQDRKQFSRSLAQYQIVQSYLAAMACELCATEAAAEAAIAAVGSGESADAIGAAKVRAGQAARVVTWHGHQVHGAIGFTREFPLNIWTRRLWAWREEYGNEAHWARLLGAALVHRGADALWANLTYRGETA